MLTDNRADYRTQDWFLIACDGDLVLKLASDLMIGEDERGQTVLSPAREDALLRITCEHGCLTLQALAMDWTSFQTSIVPSTTSMPLTREDLMTSHSSSAPP